jgi:hypothetical protein
MSAEISDVLCSLNDKFEQLVSLYERTRVAFAAMQQDNDALKAHRQELESKLVELEEKNKRLLITQAFVAADGNSEEAKEKISKIVRDIDKCITLLTK